MNDLNNLVDAIFHGVTIGLLLLHFLNAKHQSEINKMQNRKIDKLQRTINELEEVKHWKK